MADKETQDDSLELFFPFKGQNNSVAHKDQPPLTTPLIFNCRGRDVTENKIMGGQRQGLLRVFEEQAGEDRPVIKMLVCTNTYITPE